MSTISTVSPEENQRIAAEFATFQKSHPEFIFTQRNIGLIGEELERLNAVEMQFNRPFDITAATLEIAANNLIKAGRIEVASVPQPKSETPVTGSYVPFLSDVESSNPHSAIQAAKDTAYWQKKREDAEKAEREKAKKTVSALFSGSRPTQEKTERIPDSLLDADESEQLRVMQMYDGPAVRNFLERKRMRAGS